MKRAPEPVATLAQLREELQHPETRGRALQATADWVLELCLFFGTELGTAYSVAGAFVRGLERETKPIDPAIQHPTDGRMFSRGEPK